MWTDILKHKKTLLVLFLILLTLGLVTYHFVSVGGKFSGLKNDLKEIEPQEGSSYEDLEGNIVQLKDFKGQILVINSWATWSPFSKDELNLLGEIQSKFGEDVSVLSINRKEGRSIIRSYIKTYGLDESSVLHLIDKTDHFYVTNGGYAMPETVVYDQGGNKHLHTRGTIDKDSLEQTIQALLE